MKVRTLQAILNRLIDLGMADLDVEKIDDGDAVEYVAVRQYEYGEPSIIELQTSPGTMTHQSPHSLAWRVLKDSKGGTKVEHVERAKRPVPPAPHWENGI